jgi:hypothetical protein
MTFVDMVRENVDVRETELVVDGDEFAAEGEAAGAEGAALAGLAGGAEAGAAAGAVASF